jgi:hypothetical protein
VSLATPLLLSSCCCVETDCVGRFITDSRKPLHLAIASLCLKAWRAREKAQAENPQALPWLETPQFILQLRRQREAKEAKMNEAKGHVASYSNLAPQAEEMKLTPLSQSQSQSQQSQSPAWATPNTRTASTGSQFPQQQPGQHMMGQAFHDPMFSPDDFAVMDDMAMDWQRWDTLLSDFEIPVQPTPAALNPGQLQFLGQYGQQGYSWPLPVVQTQTQP